MCLRELLIPGLLVVLHVESVLAAREAPCCAIARVVCAERKNGSPFELLFDAMPKSQVVKQLT